MRSVMSVCLMWTIPGSGVGMEIWIGRRNTMILYYSSSRRGTSVLRVITLEAKNEFPIYLLACYLPHLLPY